MNFDSSQPVGGSSKSVPKCNPPLLTGGFVTLTRVCEYCGLRYEAQRVTSKFCGTSCRKAASRARQNPEKQYFEQFLHPTEVSDGVRASVDWIGVTFPYSRDPLSVLPRHGLLTPGAGAAAKAKHYDKVLKLKAGQVSWHSERENMGVHLDLSGDALREIRAAGGFDEELVMLRYLISGGRPTRLDLALDYVGDDTATPGSLRSAWAAAQIHVKAQKFQYIEGLSRDDNPRKKEETFYIGSRRSPQFFRAYNKGAEMEMLKQAWLRVEMENKGKVAKALGEVAQWWEGDILSFTRAHVRSYLSVDLPWWQLLISDAPAMEHYLESLDTDTKKWLLKVAIPLAAKWAKAGDEDIQKALLKAVTGEID